MCKKDRQKIKDYQKQYRENMSDEQKQKYRENMTDEQKQKYKNNRKQFIENMTDEERQKYKEAINKRDRDSYNKMTDEEKQKHRKKYKDLSEEQKQTSVDTIKMSLTKIKFADKEVNKKEFYSSKQAISIYSVDLNKIVVSNKLKINDTTYKYICGYLNNDTIQPLRVILPHMDEKIYKKYNEIWEVIRNLLKKGFTISPVQDDIYLIAKFKIFDKLNRTIYNSILIHTGKKHYICFPIINNNSILNIDSILKIDKIISHKAYSKHFRYGLRDYINDKVIDEDSDSDIDDIIDSHLNFLSTRQL